MKKISVYILTFFLLTNCNKNNENSNAATGNTDYEFTVTFDSQIYKVRGNTANDPGYKGPTTNKCIATNKNMGYIELSIQDITWHNYLSGNPFKCGISITPSFTAGTNLMTVNLYFNGFIYSYYKNYNANPGANGGGDNRLPIFISDLGTPLTGVLGESNIIFGNTIKGSYSGVVYTIPSGSNNATVPHNLSINFKAVRQY